MEVLGFFSGLALVYCLGICFFLGLVKMVLGLFK